LLRKDLLSKLYGFSRNFYTSNDIKILHTQLVIDTERLSGDEQCHCVKACSIADYQHCACDFVVFAQLETHAHYFGHGAFVVCLEFPDW
jgi:hypothetical protein